MTIYLLRHAETDLNKKNIMQGRSNPTLSKKGMKDASDMREKLKDYKIDICYTSPLIRSMQTSFTIVGDRCLIIKDDRLLERELGEFEGQNKIEINKKHNLKEYDSYKLNLDNYGIEPIRDVYERVEDFLKEIREKHPKENILIVSHSVVIRCLHNVLHNCIENPDNIEMGNCYFEEIKIK